MNTLAGGGTSLKQAHDRIRKIAECLDDKGLAALRQARQAVGQMWPQLEARGEVGLKEEVEKLKALLAAEDFYESLSAIGAAGKSSRPPTARYTKRPMPTVANNSTPPSRRSKGGRNGVRCRNQCGSRCCNRWPLAAAPSLICLMARSSARNAVQR